jgi:hypothetical protein
MGTEVKCNYEKCKYCFDNHCTRGEIEVKRTLAILPEFMEIMPDPVRTGMCSTCESDEFNTSE